MRTSRTGLDSTKFECVALRRSPASCSSAAWRTTYCSTPTRCSPDYTTGRPIRTLHVGKVAQRHATRPSNDERGSIEHEHEHEHEHERARRTEALHQVRSSASMDSSSAEDTRHAQDLEGEGVRLLLLLAQIELHEEPRLETR